MRLLAYADDVYRRDGDAVFAGESFTLFLAQLAQEVDELTLIGRLDQGATHVHNRLPAGIRFVPLPAYPSLAGAGALRAMARSLRRFWAASADADAVWLLGPHPLAIAFALLGALRGLRVVLGVRQDMPSYARSRHPSARWVHVTADALELAFHALARVFPVVVVGPELAAKYARSRATLEIEVSLVRERDIVDAGADGRAYDAAELSALSVGRLDAEKNPLLLADVLAGLREHDPRWRLRVCGDGPLKPDLERRLAELGVADSADLLGYVPIAGGLHDLYRTSHAFLHVSWTEGMPQVLLEAFAARLPVVATAVGGVPDAVGGAALLIPPGDPAAAVAALRTIADDRRRRTQLADAGTNHLQGRTMDDQCRRIAAFIAAGGRSQHN